MVKSNARRILIEKNEKIIFLKKELKIKDLYKVSFNSYHPLTTYKGCIKNIKGKIARQSHFTEGNKKLLL